MAFSLLANGVIAPARGASLMRLLFRFHPREDLSHGTFEQRSGDLARTWCCARDLRGATAARPTRRRRSATRSRSRSQSAAHEAVALIPVVDRAIPRTPDPVPQQDEAFARAPE